MDDSTHKTPMLLMVTLLAAVFTPNAYSWFGMPSDCKEILVERAHVKGIGQIDHQNNVRVVIDESGNVEETNDYYPYGMLMAAADGTIPSVQPYKYAGKEHETFVGMNTYDYGPRKLSPSKIIFTSPDPLCEENYQISPYVYCAANPVMLTDLTGKKIVYEGSDEDIELFRAYFDDYNQNSKFFKYVFDKLDESKTLYTIRHKKSDNKTDSESINPFFFDIEKQTIVIADYKFLDEVTSNNLAIGEELYHAWQYENSYFDGNAAGHPNVEFEAITFSLLAFLEIRQNINGSFLYSINNWIDELEKCFDSENFLDNLRSPGFANSYRNHCTYFMHYNNEKNIGNSLYKMGKSDLPELLLDVMKNIR